MIHDTRAGQQFRQLPMFMSAREIRDEFQALDGDREDVITDDDEWTESDDELFDRKYEEANDWKLSHGTSWSDKDGLTLADSILKHGVENPISLQIDRDRRGDHWKPEILGGHHRVAVMHKHRPDDLMPVEHFEHTTQAQRSLGERY